MRGEKKKKPERQCSSRDENVDLMTEKRPESEGGAKGLPNFEITHPFTNK